MAAKKGSTRSTKAAPAKKVARTVATTKKAPAQEPAQPKNSASTEHGSATERPGLTPS